MQNKYQNISFNSLKTNSHIKSKDMKKVLSNFTDAILSKEMMRTVNGGKRVHYQCQCCNGPGTWTAYYDNTNDMANAVGTYCTNGGPGPAGECLEIA